MKNKFLKPKYFLSLGVIAFAFIIGLSYSSQILSSSQSKLHSSNSGLNICFQRISQTFTALMIRDVNSNYLTRDFRANTGDCLQEVSRSFSALGSYITKSTQLSLNNLKSDLHWFDKKIDRVNEMASNGEIDITQSNISGKYSELEVIKSDLENQILKSIEGISNLEKMIFASIVLAQFAFLLSGIAFFFYRKMQLAEIDNVESFVERAKYEDSAIILNKIENTFKNNHLKKSTDFLFGHIKMLEEENDVLSKAAIGQNQYSDKRYEIPLESIVRESTAKKEGEVSSFSLALNPILDRVQQRALSATVTLDTSLEDEFSVYAETEVLQQVLSALMNYSIDQASEVATARKVELKSKSLGGIAYCKVSISNYIFSPEEIELFNGGNPTGEMSLNLILLKEMCKDSQISIALRNKQNSSQKTSYCEIELIFNRAQETRDLVKIVKGKKSEILNLLNP